MKKTWILLFFFLASPEVIAQKCKVTVLTKDADITLSGILVGQPVRINNEIENEFLVVAKKGYVTYGERNEEIIKKGSTASITLSEIKKPAAGMKSRNIEFSGFIDAGNHSGKTWGYNYFAGFFVTSGFTLDDPMYTEPIPKLMQEWGFNMIGKNTDLDIEEYIQDLFLAGEIIGYGKDTRGSGHQVSVLVNWSLYEVNSKKVIFNGTSGGFSDSKKAFGVQEEFKLALKDAAISLMSDQKFQGIALRAPDSSSSVKIGDVTKMPLIPAPKYTGYSEMVKRTMNSVVTVKNGESHGCGFIISKSGYLLTNYHVIAGNDTFEVILDNGFSMKAVLIKSDDFRDVALLKITSGSGYAPLAINRKMNELEVGSEVIAIGTPEDLQSSQTVAKGIVSGKRELEDNNKRKNTFIQTNINSNSGNNGGPLLNINGEVVGIVVPKLVGQSTEGPGFAIPVGEAVDKLNIDFQ